MWIHPEKAIIDGKVVKKEDIYWQEFMEKMAERIDVLKLDPSVDVIGREKEEFEKEYPITCGADLINYLFANFRFHHLTKNRKATFSHAGITLYMTFT